MVSSRALTTLTFLANLLATVALLALTLWSGRRGRRPLHYALAVATLLSLAGAIVQAELYGRNYEFSLLRKWVHLGFAFTALALVPFVAVTGWRLRTRPQGRAAHRRAVGLFVAATGAAIATAGWMFLSARPL